MVSLNASGKSICILFSSGGLGDVGRHAVRAALDLGSKEVSKINVLSTKSKEFLFNEPKWNCGCPVDHSTEFTPEEMERLSFQQIDFDQVENLHQYFDGVDAVISCLGNRQFFLGDRVASVGTKKVIDSMNHHKINRGVFMSSIGIGDDWPPVEWHWAGKIMATLFRTVSRREFRDLTQSEKMVRSAEGIDYLLVRPLGLGEDVLPTNEWQLQKKKYEDKVYFNFAKLDCARFMLKEALDPSMHNKAVVIGGKLEN